MKRDRSWLLMVAFSAAIAAAVTTAWSSSLPQGHYYQALCFHANSLPLYWRGPCRVHPNNSNAAWLAAESDATAHNKTAHGGRKQAGSATRLPP